MHHTKVIQQLIAVTEQFKLLFLSAVPVLHPFYPAYIISEAVLRLLLSQLVFLLEKLFQLRRCLNLHVDSVLVEIQKILVFIALVTSEKLLEGGIIVQRLEFGLNIRVLAVGRGYQRSVIMVLAIELQRLTNYHRFCKSEQRWEEHNTVFY